MAGRVLGDVLVVINPDATGFRSLADVQIRKQLAGFRPQVTLNPNTKEMNAAITEIQGRMKELNSRLSQLRIDANSKPAEATIARLQARLATLSKQMSSLTMAADTKKLDAAIAAEQAKVAALKQQMSSLQVNADDARAAAKIAALRKEAADLDKSLDSLEADVDVDKALTRLIAIEAELKVLKSSARAVQFAADTRKFTAQIAASEALITQLKHEASDIRLGANIDTAKLLTAEATLLGMEHTVSNLGKTEVPKTSTAMDAFFSSSKRGTTASAAGWRLLTGHISLFGGALNRVLPKMFTSVAVWHLLLDAAVEIVAVWTPAIVAVTAFAAAAKDAAVEVYNRMNAVHTEMDATGRTIPQLTGGFEKMQAAVRPQVYQLFGDALLVMNSRGGSLNKVITQTGTVLDRLAARMVYALTTGSGVNKFMEGAVGDVAKLGDSFANLGSIFASVFRAVPGYAEILLSVGDAVLHVISVLTNFAEPAIAVGLALHGFFIYGGLAITMSLGLVAGIVKLTGAFGKFNEKVTLVGLNALKSFGSTLRTAARSTIEYGGTLLDLARNGNKAAAASLALGDAQKLLTKIPTTVWVVAAAAALITLIHAIATSRDTAQQFNDTMQQTIDNAPLANVATLIQQTQAVTSARLADSTRKLNHAIRENTSVNAGRAGTLNSNGAAIQNLDNAQRHYTEGTIHLSEQQKLISSRVSGLSKEFGGNTQALGALNAAGITTGQILDKNGDHWQQALIQVHATTAAYAAMGTQSGVLGNDLDVLGRTVTDQYQAVQKLNQGWDAFITDVTGTQGSFDTAAEGFRTLADHSGKLSFSLGKLKASYADSATALKSQGALASATAAVASAQDRLRKLQSSGKASADQLRAAHSRLTAAQDRLSASQLTLLNMQKQGKSAIDALTPAGLALNQAFTDQVGNLGKLFDSWRTAGLAGNLFTSGVRAGLTPMLKYAAGSQEATAQLVALAQEAGYQGPVSFAALTKWLGTTHGATRRLKDITNQATTQEALLTGAMQAQGSFIANQLLGQINSAILKYAGVAKAVTAYGTAVARSGKNSSDAQAKMTTAISAIVAAELAMGDNTSQMASIVAKTFGISMPAAMGRVKSALGDLAAKALPGAQSAFVTFAEVGLDKTKVQAHSLWNEIVARLGPKLDDLGSLAGGPAKKKFIDWAENGLHLTKNEAQNLWRELVVLQGHIDNLHGKNVKVNFVGSGSGNIAFKESIPGVTVGPSSSGILGFHAAGGRIPGFSPGVDNYHAVLSGGEFVLAPETASAMGYDNLERINKRHVSRRTGYSSGGVVGKFSGLDGPSGLLTAGQPYMGKVEAAFGRAVEAAFAKAVIAKFRKDMNTLGGSGGAIVSYARSFLGKIPYVFGGNSLSSGIDCSGFTQAVYSKFGIHAPRTSESQYQWATPSGPVPGSLAFYVSPAGGPPPGHVAIVQNNSSVISQGGGMGPKIESLKFMPLMGTGVPKGGLPSSRGGGGNQSIFGAPGKGGRYSGSQLQQLWIRAGGRPGAAGNMAAIALAESGGDPNAHNPSGATGLWQILGNPFPGNARDPLTNAEMAVAKYNASGYYPWISDPVAARLIRQGITRARGGRVPGKGGRAPGMAAGGTVASFQSGLRAAQSREYHDYLGFRKAELSSLHTAKKGSYLSGHKATITGELGTLAKRQSAEEAAYDAVFHKGAAKTVMSHLNSALKAVVTTTHDKALSYSGPGGHPGWLHALQSELSRLEHIATGPVPAGARTAPHGPKLTQAAFMARLKNLQSAEYHDYLGLAGAFKAGLRHPAKGSWLYSHRGQLGKDLTRLRSLQSAEEAGYDNIRHHGTSLPNLQKEIGRVNAELSALGAGELSHLPGGHPGWVKGLRGQLTNLDKLLAVQPFNAPWAPGNLGPVHTALPGVETFDRGGYLRPGLNLAWNGTGRPEPVGHGGGDTHLHLHNNGVIGSQAELESWFVRMANHTSRTGKLTQAVRQASR